MERNGSHTQNQETGLVCNGKEALLFRWGWLLSFHPVVYLKTRVTIKQLCFSEGLVMRKVIAKSVKILITSKNSYGYYPQQIIFKRKMR